MSNCLAALHPNWQLYWGRSNRKCRQYNLAPPGPAIQDLLDRVAESKNPVFFD
ncbi:DUF3024 domain-containing protein [Actinomycetaceae bacterium MB13-C1-2]|nr:DUF3024 domain-containing protein [Actinomycetaceae bacterium MB13-C1-2]